ncbi:CHAT domain protein [Enhygromyxa salina]|uniref:CHAT domain protein n=1 Tax=Enhygromyxa salina TaxID=215803 RepID=A0A2S9YHN6_9BACT|nr:CHAT domain-containing protein [Enhygromyxa salina]PRQ04625.1 CHAT domain protein [Enhygromyxa salina]
MTTAHLHLTNDRRELALRIGDKPENRRPFGQAAVDELSELTRRYDRAVKLREAAEFVAIGRQLATWLEGSQGWVSDLRELSAPLIFEIATPKQVEPRDRVLLDAPWELLHDENDFWARDISVGYTPLRRVGKIGEIVGPREGAFSVLFMAASPAGVSELDFEHEEALILDATEKLGIDLFVEETGTAAELSLQAARLGSDDAHALHVVHISCHGHNSPEPVLALEDETGALERTSARQLFDALGAMARNLALLFVSACSTAAGGGFTRDQDSVALALARAGFPAVLGWAAPVGDYAATTFASKLYERLALGDPLEEAVVRARLVLLARRIPNPDWHLARLFLGPAGGGQLARPRGARRKQLPIHSGFLAGDRRLPVAGPEVFVGRRTLLQRCVRQLRSPDHAGVLLHGPGNIGKSSLAARVVDRMCHHDTVVVHGRFDGRNLIETIHDSLGTRVESWYREWSLRVEDELDAALRDLLDGVLGEAGGARPMLLVLDDFEQLLERRPGALHVVQASVVATMSAILHAFRHATTRSRLLLTSRYRFTLLDRSGRELTSALATVPLTAFTRSDAIKRCRREPRLVTDDDLRLRCAASCRGNPAVLALLLKRAGIDPSGCKRVLEEIEGLHEHDPNDEELADLLGDIAINDLLDSLAEGDRELLRRALVFQIPLPLTAAAILASAGEACNGDGERLIAWGVWEELADIGDGGRAFVVTNCVRAVAIRGLDDEQLKLQPETARSLVALLARHWAPVRNHVGDPAKMRAGYELVELASKTSNWDVASSFGQLALAWVARSRPVQVARSYARDLVQRLEAADAPPNPLLYEIAARIHQLGDDGEFHHHCLVAALSALENTAQYSRDDHSRANYNLAMSMARRGRVQEAEVCLRKALKLLEGSQSERDRAIITGRLGDILVIQGRFAEALTIREEIELPIYLRSGDLRSWALTKVNIADILERQGQPDAAIRILKSEALPTLKRLRCVREAAICMGKLAMILTKRGDMRSADHVWRMQIETFERLGDLREVAIAWGMIADTHREMEQLDEALHIHRSKQLPIAERTGDLSMKAGVMGRIAHVLRAKGDLSGALQIRLEQEIPAYETLGDERERAIALHNVAQIYRDQGDFDEALRVLDSLLPIYDRLRTPAGRAGTMSEIADILQHRGDRDEALKMYLEEIIPTYQKLKYARDEAIAHGRVGNIYQKTDKLDEALSVLSP